MAGRQDRRSPEAQAYRKLYKTALWQSTRLAQLQRKPLCEWCRAKGIITAATVCHHETPHKGDRAKFYAGPFISLCAPCHDTEAAQIERRGFTTNIGLDGWPTHEDHPANSGLLQKPSFGIPFGIKPSAIPVEIVIGPPASGKTTYAKANAGPHDHIIDYDDYLLQVGAPRWGGTLTQRKTAFRLRDQRLKALANTCTGKAFVILSAPTKAEREAWLSALGPKARCIVLQTDRKTCIDRIIADLARRVDCHRAVL